MNEIVRETFLFSLEMGSFTWKCRCSGQYIITEHDLENGQNVVCCSMCTLCIKVLYAIEDEQEH